MLCTFFITLNATAIMRPYHYLCASAAILLLFSCEKKEEEKLKPEPVTPKIEIPQESQAIFSQGINLESGTTAQSKTVKFSANASWTTDVTDTKVSSWLSVSPNNGGAGSVTMTVTAQPNTGTEGREASVAIKCGTVSQKFSVKQAGVPKVDVTVVSLNKAELALIVGEEATLTATVKPDNATDKTVTWSSSDATIAMVTDGKVKAVKEGKTTITAKAGEITATCKINVTKIDVESIELDKASLKLGTGQYTTLIATVKPEDATYKKITWLSTDETVASVDENGKVTALKKGEVTITAKAEDKEDSCVVSVYTSVESVSIEQSELKLVIGNTFKLVGVINPHDADVQGETTWKSSEETVASVNNEGLVTAIKEGEVSITFSVDGKSATCIVKCETASGSNEDMGSEDWK